MSIRKKMLLTFFTSVCGLLILLALILQYEVHRHFLMVVCPPVNTVSHSLTQQIQIHFEQALTQSLLWTLVIFVAVTAVLATLISRAMTHRILTMQNQAERIARGDWSATVPVEGRDELASLGNTLNYLSSQLDKQERFRKNLMQDIAHELRTPLTTLRSQIQAFYDGIWEPSQEHFQSCLEEIERFQTLVSSVETLYEVDVSSEPISHRIDLCQVVQPVSQLFEARCQRAGLKLSYIEAASPVWVKTDPNHVSQITWNLLDNAVKFTPNGGGITVVVGYDNERAFLRVEDTGIGIPEAELDNIFERFYRVEKSRDRRTGGSGLGLAIVKRLVELSHGTINVKSTVNQGSTFTVWWPHEPERSNSH
ncbi:MAG: HAMP domain-containing histidine kinase [Alicyclobacillus sp.]|nr:HAMP domain-containing histidine kinase [Alicyclobacillus sp.]